MTTALRAVQVVTTIVAAGTVAAIAMIAAVVIATMTGAVIGTIAAIEIAKTIAVGVADLISSTTPDHGSK